MSFYVYDLEAVCGIIQQYADNRGLIPQPEDNWHNFQWDRRHEKIFGNKITGIEDWQKFQTKASLATQKAEQALLDLKFTNQ